MSDIDKLPLQHFIEVVEIKYPQSKSTWSAPSSHQWRQYAQTILLTAGRAKAKFKRDALTIKSPALVWLPAGFCSEIEFFPGSYALIANMSDQWLIPVIDNQLDKDISFRLLVDTLHSTSINDTQTDVVQQCLNSIQQELFKNLPGTKSIVTAQLTTLLTYLYRFNDEGMIRAKSEEVSSVISQRFLQLVELHFREHWKIGQYAKELGVTERRLETNLQRDMKESPSSLIQRKLMNEASIRLAHSPLSISEIAYGLGFRDPAYFNRFFKRNQGDAPGVWRRKVKAKQITVDESFAAWP